MSELHDQLARVKLHKGLAPLTCIVSRQQFTGVRPLFQTFPARAVFQPTVPANQRRVLQEAPVNDLHNSSQRDLTSELFLWTRRFFGAVHIFVVSGLVGRKKTAFRSKERHASAGPAREAFCLE